MFGTCRQCQGATGALGACAEVIVYGMFAFGTNS